MTKASRDTQTRRRERKEGEKREEKRGRGQVFRNTNKRPGTHQRDRGEPEHYIQDTPKTGKEKNVFPVATQASKDTPREEGFPAVTKASRDTQTRRRERKEGEKREEKRGRGQVFPVTNKRPGHTREQGVNLSVTFRNTPTSEGGREGVGGGRRTELSTGSNEP